MSQLLPTVNGLKTWVCVKGRVHELRSSLMMVISVSCFRLYGVESEISSTMWKMNEKKRMRVKKEGP